MYGRRGDLEVLLHICFGRGISMDFGIIVDEGKVLPLSLCIFIVHGGSPKAHISTLIYANMYFSRSLF